MYSNQDYQATPFESTDWPYGKVVILNFDDNRLSQYVEAKPIPDKYGFKATFYAVCIYLDNKKGYMNWSQIETLQREGHEIGSHTMNHANLHASSKKSLEYQIGKSQECLKERGISATSFPYHFDEGSDNITVVKIVAKYYDQARTASSPLLFYTVMDGNKSQDKKIAAHTPKVVN